MGSSVVEQLRAEIRRIEGRPVVSARYLASGRIEVDRLLVGGGFKCGAISQLVGGRASGKTTIALSAIAEATRHVASRPTSTARTTSTRPPRRRWVWRSSGC